MAGVFQGLAPPTKENTLYRKYKIPTIKEKLVAHIILILGKAGEKEKAHYSVDKGLNLTLNSNKVSKKFIHNKLGAAFEMVCFGLNLGLVALYATIKREVNVVQENGKNVKKAFLNT